ncbi:MAG TPA: DUF4062 domain-containing protein, partial [Candidatus Bathyarchaeia archaeon]|nr:DUF4062 domain-containing protein [Candidatus Bathyarchaeia archaeon]
LGFEPVLSEKGNIAFTPDSPLDMSCYREAATADIFILIIGGRYGTEASGKQRIPSVTFFERYESITKKEYDSAVARDIPVYVLVETNVYSEYQTYLKNKENKEIVYAHAQSVNIFRFIEEILSKPRNNPMHTFERFSDMETWLREQWAGLFRELLQRQSQQQQLADLSGQISRLQAINETLKKYLEAVMTRMPPDDSTHLIESEKHRLAEIEQRERVRKSLFYSQINNVLDIPLDSFLQAAKEANSFADFAVRVHQNGTLIRSYLSRLLLDSPTAREAFNEVRQVLGLDPLKLNKGEAEDLEKNSRIYSQEPEKLKTTDPN